MIDKVHELSEVAQTNLSCIEYFPGYDEGGKEILENLIHHPSQLEKQLTYEHHDKRLTIGETNLLLLPKNTHLEDVLKNDWGLESLQSATLRYLSSLSKDNRLSIKIYIKYFKYLKLEDKLDAKIKVALLKLVVVATSNHQKVLENTYVLADLYEMHHLAVSIAQKCGVETLQSFFLLQRAPLGSLDKTITIFKYLNRLLEDFDTEYLAFNLLERFSRDELNFESLLESLIDTGHMAHIDEIYLEGDITSIVERFKNDLNVVVSLPDEHLKVIVEQYEIIQGYCKEWKHLRIGELVRKSNEIRLVGEKSILDTLKLIAIARLAIRIQFQIYLHHTQVLTVLGLLRYKHGCIAQVKTGEGKSMIVTLLAYVLAMFNQRVHIISSSTNLSIRDQQKVAEFFKFFEITTSYICEEHVEEKYFKSQILYGTATDFEFAIMREMLYQQKLFVSVTQEEIQKRFDHVIIDELDNLTIDTAGHSARLSHPSEDSYEWIYLPIFDYVRSKCRKDEGLFIASEHLESLREYLRNYLNGRFSDKMDFLTDEKLLIWLNSAHYTLFDCKENVDYIVEQENTNSSKKNKIQIIDKDNTGRKQNGMRWSNGIHEFLEIKHHILPETESITPLSISHAIHYAMYKCIYGLTGTMGTLVERDMIKKIYQVDSFDVPTYRSPQREDLPMLLIPTNHLHRMTILEKIEECRVAGRPILVLCPTIEASQKIEELLVEKNIPHEMLNEIQRNNEEDILINAGLSGAVTIATNTAGRGTDIKISPAVSAKGGLHVLITFFPESERVALQASGRAGRQGQQGSSQMIISLENLDLPGIDIQDKTLYPEIIRYLESRRLSKERLQKHILLLSVELERNCFSFVSEFFRCYGVLQHILDNDHLLEKYARVLSSRKIISKNSLNFIHLNTKEQKLATDIIELLSKDCTSSQWKNILKEVGKRIKKKIINSWAMVYTDIQKKIANSDLYKMDILNEKLVQMMEEGEFSSPSFHLFLSNLDSAFKESKNQNLKLLNEEIEVLYTQFMKTWEIYRDVSGSFYLDYIREISGVSLKYL